MEIVELIVSIFRWIFDILPKHGFVVLSSPKNLHVDQVGVNTGFRVVETYLIYEHRSLTRQLVVLKKP